MIARARTLLLTGRAAAASRGKTEESKVRLVRKLEVVSVGPRPPRARAADRAASSTRILAARAHSAQDPADDALQLVRDDRFDVILSDAEIEGILVALASRTASPHAELLRRMLGMESLDEHAARTLLRRILEHRRKLAKALGRDIHVRVAALDLHSMRPARRHDSRPIVLESSLLERALEEASSDALTGLPQRAHFMSLLRHELRQRRQRDFAVVFIDVDGLKRVNDTFGHARGDDVLRALASCGRAAIRHGDVIARIGGDEFALLLVDVTPADADAAIARLRARFEERTATYGTSISAGVVMAEAGLGANELLELADDAMYREKRTRGPRS
jgi:diguanylate cyclase (GGDEF)-like protein